VLATQVVQPSLIRSALGRIQHNWADSTNTARQRVMQEFAGTLSLFGRTTADCTPDDVLAHAELFAQQHAGSVLPDGQSVAAPSSIEGMLAHLSTGLSLLGRVGPYERSTGQGNPLSSPEVTYYRRGYGLDLFRAGYEERSAVPLSEPKLRTLLNHLDRCAAEPSVSAFRRLLLSRDAIGFLLMWQTTMRGDNAGRIELDDLRPLSSPAPGFRDGAPPLRFPLPPAFFSPASGMQIEVRGTKPVQGRRSDPMVVMIHPEPALCLLRRINAFSIACAAPGLPPGCRLRRFLLRPANRGGNDFEERALTSDALNQRLGQHLSAAGVDGGETNHSFRRGALQAAHAEGVSPPLLHRLGQIRTPDVLRRYLHPSRHLGGPKRRRPAASSSRARRRSVSSGESSADEDDAAGRPGAPPVAPPFLPGEPAPSVACRPSWQLAPLDLGAS
jgi:hypothetical protein